MRVHVLDELPVKVLMGFSNSSEPLEGEFSESHENRPSSIQIGLENPTFLRGLPLWSLDQV